MINEDYLNGYEDGYLDLLKQVLAMNARIANSHSDCPDLCNQIFDEIVDLTSGYRKLHPNKTKTHN